MGRLKEFRFWWVDAWYDIEDGYDIILEVSESGSTMLQCLVNGKVQSIDITDCENGFIEALEQCNIKSWNKRCYIKACEDGNQWDLLIVYDDVCVQTNGMNGYPKEFGEFLDVLVEKIGLQECYFCRHLRSHRKSEIRGTQIEEWHPMRKREPIISYR